MYVVNINHVHVEQFHYPPRLGYAAQSWEDFGIGSEKTTLTTNGHGQGVSNNSVSGYKQSKDDDIDDEPAGNSRPRPSPLNIRSHLPGIDSTTMETSTNNDVTTASYLSAMRLSANKCHQHPQ